MPKKITKLGHPHFLATNSAIEFVALSTLGNSTLNAFPVDENVLALQTSRLSPYPTHYDINSPYQGFNLGLHVGDLPQQVAKNRQFLEKLLPNNTKIQWLEQVHGSDVAQITHVHSQPLKADAAITGKKNICLAIMTADCLPILLAAQQGHEIAAIHGGWRPLAANIISNTINKMDTSASELCAWLGPCIGSTAFEVGQDVLHAFVNHNQLFAQAFIKHTKGKYLANLQKIAQIQLAQLGVTRIKTLSECTFSNVDKYYSYRKSATTGRMASLICLR